MLTDTFIHRYSNAVLWKSFGEPERKLLFQAQLILSEDLFPVASKGQSAATNLSIWQNVNSRLSRELGRRSLHAKTGSAKPSFEDCENFMHSVVLPGESADIHMKERVSLVELVFLEAYAQIEREFDPQNPMQMLLTTLQSKGTGSPLDDLVARKKAALQRVSGAVEELNARFRSAGANLQCHKGIVQRSDDALVEREVETPFWKLLRDQKWKHVSADMQEAIDLRDGGSSQAAFSAAKALEGALKIAVETKGLLPTKVTGAVQFVEILESPKAHNLLAPWEGEVFRTYFKLVRNALAHASGSSERPILTADQTHWAINFSIVSIQSLVNRL